MATQGLGPGPGGWRTAALGLRPVGQDTDHPLPHPSPEQVAHPCYPCGVGSGQSPVPTRVKLREPPPIAQVQQAPNQGLVCTTFSHLGHPSLNRSFTQEAERLRGTQGDDPRGCPDGAESPSTRRQVLKHWVQQLPPTFPFKIAEQNLYLISTDILDATRPQGQGNTHGPG